MWWRRLRYVLLLVALCAIATCPAAKRSCTAKTQAQEADDILEYLANRVASYYIEHGHLPPTPAGPTPTPAACCEQGGACSPDATLWSTPGWRDLAFSVDGTFRYSYQYLPDASGTSAIVRATGDLDCDDKRSEYMIRLKVVPTGARATELTRTWSRIDPYE
jgi:hypothetical protein